MFKKIIKMNYLILCIICSALMVSVAYLQTALPDSFSITQGNKLKINAKLPVSAQINSNVSAQNSFIKSTQQKFDTKLNLFGVVPVKNASVSVVQGDSVNVLGTSFAVKLYTDGVLVVELSAVDTVNGEKEPAKKAGLKVGDLVKYINGVEVTSNADIAYAVENSGGKQLSITIKRKNKTMNINLVPEYSVSSECFKCGIWVRDSSAGIGTLTFYNPANNTICGLGHGLCDVDTGQVMAAGYGELVGAKIVSCTKSKKGSPGELKGKITSAVYGDLLYNCSSGVFGNCGSTLQVNNYFSVANIQDVVCGKAEILTTVDGREPQYYDCVIEKINYKNKVKNLVVRITDQRLLDVTGGIVQGMSGSPIIQNGKLAGAVTHVLVDKPDCGYGIFAENMLKISQKISPAQ